MLNVYTRKQVLLVGLLGFFSGLPLALTSSTLTAWLFDSGVERAAIGLFAAVATPYAFKFIWSPLMDGLRLPVMWRLGKRRSWILLTQIALVCAMAAMAFSDPAVSAFAAAIAALVLSGASASQDIVIDAYRVERLDEREQGAGAAASVFGYRVGMLVSGAGALFIADQAGWEVAYLVMAGVMALGILVTLAMKETTPYDRSKLESDAPFATRVQRFVAELIVAPFKDFMARKYWVAILILVILYKLPDAFLGIMFNPFLLDIGFSKTEIAQIAKVYGFAATMLGVFLGGWLVAKMGMYKALWLAAFINIPANMVLIAQAQMGADSSFLILSVTAENITGGMSTATLIAYLSMLCKTNYTATQYALLSSFAAFGRTWLSTPSGWVAESSGWEWFFGIAALMTIPSLLLLMWLAKKERH